MTSNVISVHIPYSLVGNLSTWEGSYKEDQSGFSSIGGGELFGVIDESSSKIDKKKQKIKPEDIQVRKFFPESWLFGLLLIG